MLVHFSAQPEPSLSLNNSPAHPTKSAHSKPESGGVLRHWGRRTLEGVDGVEGGAPLAEPHVPPARVVTFLHFSD